MLSKKNKQLIEIAKLGLSGEKKTLFDFLQKIAVLEINQNHHELYNSIITILSENNLSKPEISFMDNFNKKEESYDYDMETNSIWLPPTLQKRINKIIDYFKITKNQKDTKKLNRILLYGPPGTGKTTIGFYIARKLNLPTKYVKITDVISSRLGETMKNISNIFQSPEKEIVFFDEFDAFGKTRQDNNDVGELKRIVNSIIQTLDFSANDKIVIVATNLIDTIDPAILRRFPFKIEVGPLNQKEREAFFMHLVRNEKNIRSSLDNEQWDFLLEVFNLLNLNTIDEIKSIVEKAKMEMILSSRKKVKYEDFLEVLLCDGYLNKIKGNKKNNKKILSKLLREIEKIGYPKTTISSMLGIHRNTYSKYSSKL